MKKLFFLLVVFVVVSSACGNTPAPLEISDLSKPILVNSGDEFTIVLDSNPTTGYHWEIVDELDAGIELVSKEYTNDEPVAPGSGGVDVWTFKAVSAGERQVTLGYYPPSNDPVDPQQTVTFTVTVQ